MKIVFILIIVIYAAAMSYMYLTQNSQVFNKDAITPMPDFKLENTEKISLHVRDNVVLDGVYKHAKNEDAPLLIYFGGNADDATRILLHVKNLTDFDIISFNYRGYMKSTGEPSEINLFSDALTIFDTYAQDKKVILIGRSLGTGVATYLASKRDIKGLILITPYDSIVAIAKKKYPFLPIDLLLRHKFESTTYMLHVKSPVSIIEVKDDDVTPLYHLNQLLKTIPNLSLHVRLEDTTHGDVLTHPKFEESLINMIKEF